MRISMGVEYLGTRYCGWQSQETLGLDCIQTRVEKALSMVANHPVTVVCAGRTDAGVHAFEQVIHFDTEAVRSERGWVLGTNTQLPTDIRILWARPVSADFHARFSAQARRYRYWIDNRPVRSAIYRPLQAWYGWLLDAVKMHQAAQCLVGEHDFSAFRGIDCQSKSVIRRVTEITVARQGSLIQMDIAANAFLHHMVRNIVGTLLWVGKGEKPVTWVQTVLDSRDRKQAGMTAPAEGLYLCKVDY